MWWALAAVAGLNLAQAGMQYTADMQAYQAQKAWQKYSNTMVRLSDSINQNAITTNQILAQQAFASEAVNIKKSGVLTLAKAEVAAAAAGVKGRSVNQTMFDVQRNTSNRESERQESFRNSLLAFDQQRLQSRMSAEMQQDYTYIPKPSRTSYLLQAVASTVGTGMQMSQGGSGGSGYKPQGQFTGPPAPLGSGSRYERTSSGETILWNGVRLQK